MKVFQNFEKYSVEDSKKALEIARPFLGSYSKIEMNGSKLFKNSKYEM